MVGDEAVQPHELRKKNRKAAGILLNSIVCDDEKGKAAFFLIEILELVLDLRGRAF